MWHVIEVKLNIGKKIAGLEIYNDTKSRKIQHVSKLVELTFKGESHCLQKYFRKERMFKFI